MDSGKKCHTRILRQWWHEEKKQAQQTSTKIIIIITDDSQAERSGLKKTWPRHCICVYFISYKLCGDGCSIAIMEFIYNIDNT